MKKYRLTLILAVLLVIWLAVGPQILERFATSDLNAATGLPPGVELGGSLYYTQNFDGIWRLDLQNGVAAPWWTPPEGGLVTGIAASPDGDQLAVAYAPPAEEGFQTGTTNLYLSPPDAPDLQPVLVRESRSESYRNPAWSPDGKWLYFSHLKPVFDASGATASIALDVERLQVNDLSERETIITGAEQPTLSPDGSRIGFLKFDTRTYAQGVWLANSNGSQPRELVRPGSFPALASPRFTPDGQSLIFSASGERRSLTAVGGGIARAHGAPWNVWQISGDDNALTKLTPATLDGPWTAWSPDGQQLAVLAAEGVFIVHETQFYHLAETTSEGEITWALQ